MDGSAEGAKSAWLVFAMEGGSVSQLFMACGASGHPSANCQKHQQVVHSSSFRMKSHLALTHAYTHAHPPPSRYHQRSWGDGKCSPDAVPDDLWWVCLKVRLRRVKVAMLDSRRGMRQRIRTCRTNRDGINNDGEKLLT